MKSEVIYVDESGNSGIRNRLHNLKNPYFVIGFCYCKKPSALKRKCLKLLTSLHRKNLYPKNIRELKFHPTSIFSKYGHTEKDIETNWKPHYNVIRKKMLDLIINNSDGVFAGIVNKMDVKSNTYTSEKLGIDLFKLSLEYILSRVHLSKYPLFICDHGGFNLKTINSFNNNAKNMVQIHVSDTGFPIHHDTFHNSDSMQTPGICASDFIAGSFHLALKYNITEYRDLLKPKFIGQGSKIFDF